MIILHMVEPCPPLLPTPFIQTGEKKSNKSTPPKKKIKKNNRNKQTKSPNWFALRSVD